MKVCILYDPGLRCSHPTSFDGGRNWLTNPREWSISQFSNRSSPTSSYRLTAASLAFEQKPHCLTAGCVLFWYYVLPVLANTPRGDAVSPR